MTVKQLMEKLSEGNPENEVRIFSAVDKTHDEEYQIESVEAVGGWASTQIIIVKD